jgi:hypothetical protein
LAASTANGIVAGSNVGSWLLLGQQPIISGCGLLTTSAAEISRAQQLPVTYGGTDAAKNIAMQDPVVCLLNLPITTQTGN